MTDRQDPYIPINKGAIDVPLTALYRTADVAVLKGGEDIDHDCLLEIISRAYHAEKKLQRCMDAEGDLPSKAEPCGNCGLPTRGHASTRMWCQSCEIAWEGGYGIGVGQTHPQTSTVHP